LFGLALLGSLAATVYQIRKKVVPYTIKTLILMLVLCLVTSAVAGLIVFWMMNTFIK
jgi:type III secretory pathway component EscS